MRTLTTLALVTAVAGSLITTSALADCSKAQEIALAKLTTRALTGKLVSDQHSKQIILHDCDAVSGHASASFIYNYVDAKGLQTVAGTVAANSDAVTNLTVTTHDHALAFRDQDFSEQSYGPVAYAE